MWDGAPGYAAGDTKEELEAGGIIVLSWLLYSPGLNPIECCWNWIKDYIEDKWGLEENSSYDKLRKYVKEAWEDLPDSYLAELLASMKVRCQAAIDVNGMYTKW